MVRPSCSCSILLVVLSACSVDSGAILPSGSTDSSPPTDSHVGTDTTPARCAGGRTDCAGVCVDLSSNSANCGRCGSPCTGDEVCSGGTCVVPGAPCEWTLQRTLSFDNASRAENLDDFTVLVVLDSSRIDYAMVEDQGHDLRFTEPDGTTTLPYEVERWSTGGRSYVWVRVPRIDASSSTDHIIMYYGNSSASPGEDPAATWGAAYEAVWHLGGVSDSTGNAHDLTDMGTEGASGRIGRARRFDGASDRLVADTVVGSAADLTFELWMRSDVSTGFHRPIEKMGPSGTQGWSVLQRPDADLFPRGLVFRVGSEGFYGGWGNEVSASNVYSPDTWEHVVGTFDSTTHTGRLYVGGVEVDSVVNTDGRGVADTGDPLLIGGGGEHFDGDIDEVRISTVARSAAYVSAQHASQTDTFIVYGDETSVGIACPE